MEKKYKLHGIKNIQDLKKEQNRIRRAYEDIESNFFQKAISPESVISLLFHSLLFSSSSKKKKNGFPVFRKRNKAATKSSSEASSNPQKKISKSPKNRIRRLTKTILFWEAASLIFLLGGKILFGFIQKKKS